MSAPMISRIRPLSLLNFARLALPAALTATFLALMLAPPAGADPWLLAPGEHYSSLGASMFVADSYHDLLGNRNALAGGGLHAEHSLYSYNEFGWKKRATFVLGFPFASVTRRFGGTIGTLPTQTGFGDLLLGLRFGIFRGLVPTSLELDWNPPMGYSRDSVASIGDGNSNVVGRLQIGTPIGHVGFLELEGGYRYFLDKNVRLGPLTPQGMYPVIEVMTPSNQMIGGATLGFWIGHSLLFSGRYVGSFSAATQVGSPLIYTVDTATKFPELRGDAVKGTTNDQVSQQMAGPQITYRLDDRMDLIAGSMHTLSAKNALHVDRFYVAVAVKQTKLNRLQGLLGGTGKP